MRVEEKKYDEVRALVLSYVADVQFRTMNPMKFNQWEAKAEPILGDFLMWLQTDEAPKKGAKV